MCHIELLEISWENMVFLMEERKLMYQTGVFYDLHRISDVTKTESIHDFF